MKNFFSTFKKIEKIISLFNEWLGKIVSWSIFLMMCLILYEVIIRFLFRASAAWCLEINQTYLLPIMILLSGGYVLKEEAHVRVDILYNHFNFRLKALLDVITSILFFSFCFVLIKYGCKIAWRDLIFGDRMVIEPYWPIFPVRFAIPLGGCLLLLQGLIKFFGNLIIAIRAPQCKNIVRNDHDRS